MSCAGNNSEKAKLARFTDVLELTNVGGVLWPHSRRKGWYTVTKETALVRDESQRNRAN